MAANGIIAYVVAAWYSHTTTLIIQYKIIGAVTWLTLNSDLISFYSPLHHFLPRPTKLSTRRKEGGPLVADWHG